MYQKREKKKGGNWDTAISRIIKIRSGNEMMSLCKSLKNITWNGHQISGLDIKVIQQQETMYSIILHIIHFLDFWETMELNFIKEIIFFSKAIKRGEFLLIIFFFFLFLLCQNRAFLRWIALDSWHAWCK
jgi:hypothetical protein